MEKHIDVTKKTLTLEQDNRSIEDVLQQFAQAQTAHDVDAILGFYADDSVMYTLAPPLSGRDDQSQSPPDAIRDWLESWVDGPHYKSQQATTLQEGDLAVSYRLLNMSGRRKNGEQTDMWFRDTTVLRKEDGRWLIVHQHESVPMMMDGSEKAAIHLKPQAH